ncbi:hypothetical protein BCR36DRAFT_314483 [Piromyces finnis]|uniref:Uncharacterized protein n=1 Tax=Piromyces finnis TaxID=1754191 RepID=A0A1Y1U5B8_9FUNG|nr:hypothetical protein BCR36DRAFT_314483 [Piromyces finnis]|eukprot:ORX33223.1 hypothetical protein BCR36DRAFT_314483 [Piromyces finnis]
MEITKNTTDKKDLIIKNSERNVRVEKKKIVLEEDEYIEGLSKVIKRDYFPDNDKMKIQNELLDALQEQDSFRARNLSKQLLNYDADKKNLQKNENGIDTSLSVDAYQSKYTSEDNDSFNEIIAKNNEMKKMRNEKLYGQEKTKLLMSSNAQNASDVGKTTWKYKTQNTLMFIPDSNHLLKESEEVKRQAPKQISHSNTRFDTTPSIQEIKEQERIKTQEVWKTMINSTPGLFKNEMLELQSEGTDGYKMVASTPSPNPNRIDQSDMFTWGSIEGTPLLINSGGASRPVFKIPETPRRELIGMKLSEKASSNMRKRLGKTPKSSLSHLTPKQRLTSPLLSRANALSPAAKNLLQRSLKSPGGKALMKGLSSD